MRFFFLSFFTVIILVSSLETYAANTISGKYYKTMAAAGAACQAAWKDPAHPETPACGGSSYYYLKLNGTVAHLYVYCPSGVGHNYCSGFDGWQEDIPQACEDAPNQPSTCICSDGAPKETGQYTTCDRPPLIHCDFLGRNVPASECPTFDLPDDQCPTDSTYQDGQCVNKCGKNAGYNAITNSCEALEGKDGDGNCPANYTEDAYGNCGPNACPSTHKLVGDACVLDTDPVTTQKTEVQNNSDGTSTETTTATETTNNADGTTTTTTTTTATTAKPQPIMVIMLLAHMRNGIVIRLMGRNSRLRIKLNIPTRLSS